MAYQVEKEANSIACSTNGSALPQIHVNENGKGCHGSSPAPTQASPKTNKKTTNEQLDEILLTFNKQPLIPNETALSLLKIQSKFVSSHPCLCTSRFRHTLHQLNEEHHQDLDRLCSKLSLMLKLEDEQESKKEELFDSVVPCVFGDLKGLDQISNDWLVRSGQDKTCIQNLDLHKQLNAIIGRLVTDYRAIFAIEVEFNKSFDKSDEELHHATSTEHHRKRHEEVDCCPEEIKLMKVACEELTLECSSNSLTTTTNSEKTRQIINEDSSTKLQKSVVPNTKSENGPKFCLKSLTSQEVPEKDNSIHRHPEINHNAALEDVRSRHHHRRSHHHYAHQHGGNISNRSTTTTGSDEKSISGSVQTQTSPTTSFVKSMISEEHFSGTCGGTCNVSADSTPVSSDVEHSHTPSPRRPCQRKRKERRDSIGEAQDKKFSKSSSDVFPTTCVNETKKEAAKNEKITADMPSSFGIRRIQSTVEFVTNNNQEENCPSQKSISEDEPTPTKGKCTFYVSDDEVTETTQDIKTCERTRRAIMRPRRSRKVRTDSLKENQDDYIFCEEIDSKETSSPILPWKKNNTLPPPSLSTPSPISTSSVLSLVASIKSSIVEKPSEALEDNFSSLCGIEKEDSFSGTCGTTTSEASIIGEADKADSDSTSSSTSDETLSNLDVEDVDNKSDTSSNSTSFSARYIESRNMSNTSPVQDSQHQMYQPVCWEPYGAVWKTEVDLENEEVRDEFQSTRHFGMLNSRQHLDRNQGWNRNSASENGYQESKTKIKSLSKQLSVVRKKIEEFEIKFEDAHGYRPSQAEKQSNKEVRKMILQQNRLKRQIRNFRESGDSGVNLDIDSPSMSPTRPWSPACTDFANILNVYSDNSENSVKSPQHDNKLTESRYENRVENFKTMVDEIENKLEKERQVSRRPESLEDMSPDQIIQERNCIQMALNQAQTVLNTHNATEDERVVLKDLLMRYRTVKRLVRRSSNVFIKDPCELETIPEGAEIQLTLASPQHRINIEMNSSPSRILDQADLMPARTSSLPKGSGDNQHDNVEDTSNATVSDDIQTNANEPNLHAMSRYELLNVQKLAKEDKKQLRRCLKEHEMKFLEVNGRPMPKDELKEHDVYSKYKMTKAKLKLVDALLSKLVKQ